MELGLGLVGLGLGFGGRLARRFRGRGLVGRLLLGLRLGDGGLGRGLCRDPGLLGLGRCRSFFLSCDLIERVQFFLRRQLAAPSGTTARRRVAVTSAKSSTGTSKRPIRLIDSGRSSLRRSIRTRWLSQTRSAMSVAVTEPKSVPVSPA